MTGEQNLNILLSGLAPNLRDGVFVFVASRSGALPPNSHPIMMFQEAEGTTYILPRHEAQEAGIAFEFPSRMITLNIHSSLEAVGFLARITAALAKHDMGVNPVSGFYHDHLFVPLGREKEAMRVLAEIAEIAAMNTHNKQTVL